MVGVGGEVGQRVIQKQVAVVTMTLYALRERTIGDARKSDGRERCASTKSTRRRFAYTYLVRGLVGVTLVDRLGGEEEGRTVLGSHL